MNTLSETDRLMMVVCIVFLAVGLFQGGIGPVLQDLARQTGSTTVAASSLMTVVSLTSLSSQAITALVLKRTGHRPIMLVGMIFFLCGISGIALSASLTSLLIAAVCKGIGDGALLLLGNVLAAEASKGAGPLNLVNAMFGVGAIIAPAVISVAMITTGSGMPGLWSVPFAMGSALALLLVWRPGLTIPAADSEAIAEVVHSAGHSPILKTRLIWLISALLLLEASIEASLGVWLPTLLNQSTGLSLTAASMILSWFWLLLTASRFVAAWASRKYSAFTILAFVVIFAAVGCSLLLTATVIGSATVAIAATTFLGPGLGPVLPSALSILRNAYSYNTGAATGIAFGSGSFGAGLMPPFVGVLTSAAGFAGGAGALFATALSMAFVLLAVAASGGKERNKPTRQSIDQQMCPVGPD
ncbi:MFS transporter [Rhizobium sp. AG207R]|uniref:MFS transporter n=1 Tax=Rhizobium sp. AG207R TaxID=2802287 RepID=UPI0022ABE032|nr:MFS transporter [Rhizobium sp. AG207R]MCZ3374360.1 MFS transporter [Rhizobium sp. AG207R]